MSLKLIYHPGSPFSRKVYILALELGLADEISLEKVVVAPVYYPGWSDNNDLVAKAGNPLAKIPTLVVSEFPSSSSSPATAQPPLGIFESKFICEYLCERAGVCEHRSSRAYWAERATQAASDGIMDAESLIVYEEMLRKEKGLYWDGWVVGQREKVTRGLDYLEKMVQDGVIKPKKQEEKISLAEITAAVTLSVFDQRDLDWREGRPGLTAFYRAMEERRVFEGLILPGTRIGRGRRSGR